MEKAFLFDFYKQILKTALDIYKCNKLAKGA